MTGIPIITLDYFSMMDIPTFILCNPNKEQLYALGGISERKYSSKFNAISEISFRADEQVDETPMAYYDYLVNRRLVFIEDIGYFMIIDVQETNDGIVKYKEITCQSLEVELSSRRLVRYVSGSGTYSGSPIIDPIPVTLAELLDDLLPYAPGWTLNINEEIPVSIASEYRRFDIADKTIYDFLMVDVEDSYGCVFDFDTVNKQIRVYDSNQALLETEIFISHDNVIKSLKINEVTDELATSLSVTGGNGLDISGVNPIGGNYIYNLEYFETTEWMEQSLIDNLDAWEALVISASPVYEANTNDIYTDYDYYEATDVQYEIHTGSLVAIETTLANMPAAGYPPGSPEYEAKKAERDAMQHEVDIYAATLVAIQSDIDDLLFLRKQINYDLSFDNPDNFSASQVIALQPFIIQSSYANENYIKTDTMTSASMLLEAEKLYSKAESVLDKISEPKYTFEIDSVNFMEIADFQMFRDQIALGALINIEIREGTTASPILLGMDINFDDPTDFKLTFGNRLRLDSESNKFRDLMGKALEAGNSVKVNSQVWNSFSRNYKDSVETILTGVNVVSTGPAEFMHVENGNINFLTPNLTWNGEPIGGSGVINNYYSGSGVSDITITLFSGGSVEKMYPPTAAGLTAAIGDSAIGDVIFMPDVDISGDFVMKAGVDLVGVSSRESIIRGQVTIEPACLLENLMVINQQNSADEIKAVVVKETVASELASKIKGCEIYCYQCGTGTTHAVYINDSGVTLTVENSTIVSDSNGGLGYAFSNNGGYCNVFHSGYYAKTEVFHDV